MQTLEIRDAKGNVAGLKRQPPGEVRGEKGNGGAKKRQPPEREEFARMAAMVAERRGQKKAARRRARRADLERMAQKKL